MNQFQIIGLISIFHEIIHLPWFDSAMKTPPLMEGYLNLWLHCLQLVHEKADIGLELRFLAAECVRDAIELLPEFCIVNNAPDVGRIRSVLEYLPAALAHPDIRLFQCCHRIMFNLVKVYYAKVHDFIDLIWTYVNHTLQLTAPGQEQYRVVGIVFWKEVASLEQEKIDEERDQAAEPTNHRSVRQNSHDWLSVKAGPVLLPMFFEIMCRIDPSDTEVEDPNERSLSKYATVAMHGFYHVSPAQVFPEYVLPTYEASIENAAWTIRHAALLLLFCMCPVESGHAFATPEEERFLSQHILDVLAACRSDAIPRLKETALFVLAMILSHFPQVLTQHDLCDDPEAAVQQIIDLVRPDEPAHPMILLRYGLVVYEVADAWKDDAAAYHSPLPRFFEQLVGLLKGMLLRVLPLDERQQLYPQISEALNHVIVYGSDRQHVDLLHRLFVQTLDDLDSSRHTFQQDTVRFVVQAHLSSNLTSLAIRLGRDVVDPDLNRAVDVLFGILHQQNALIFEEALMTLAGLFLHLHDRFKHDQVLTMFRISHFALLSEAPDVIHSASILLQDLFHFAGAENADQFLGFLNIEEKLLRDHPDLRQTHPFIIKAIAEMVEGVGKEEKNQELIAPLEDRLFALMQLVRAVQIEGGKKDDNEYANSLFEALAQLYRVFAVLYYPLRGGDTNQDLLNKEKAYLNEMAAFATAVNKLKKVSEPLLRQFIHMARAFADHCSRRNNVALNRAAVHSVLGRYVKSCYKPKIKKLAKEAISYLKSK
jgi:hypothetical protein